MLGLDNDELTAHGLVSRETACSMAKNALQISKADIASAVTGFAGPDGDNKTPGGTIWTAIAVRGGNVTAKEFHFSGSRNIIRTHAAIAVLDEIFKVLT